MRHSLVAVAIALVAPAAAMAQLLSFPEAEGFGQFATGARTSLSSATVYHVTNLNDSGAGSFRDAVSQSNRFVVFDVGGIINLNSAVSVKSNITIAGQTAPGGISIYGNKVSFTSANNLISRYLAVRLGTAVGREDASGLSRGTNMMFDHMSVTWGVDETFSMNPDSGYTIDNITIQNSIIGQGLDVVGHSAGGLMTLGEGSRFSVIQSLFADNVTRNPKVRGENEFINNVVYGWESAGYIMGDTVNMDSHANVIGNYFIEGPVDGSGPFNSGTANFHIYGSDNWVDDNRNGVLDGALVSSYPGADVVASPFAFPTTVAMSAQDALQYVMDHAGVSIIRDAVDTRIMQEVASYGTLGGVIVRDSDLFPGYGSDPQYVNARARLVDADADGMADNWEAAHGLSAANASDWKGLNAAGYTRLEEYLNELGAEGVTVTSTGGAWTTPATWTGGTPTLADDAVVAGTLTVGSGNAFARRLTLDGALNVTGGTLDVFDTAAANGSVTISGGAVTAGQLLLASPGKTASLTLQTGGTLQTGTITTAGGTATFNWNGGTIRATGTPNVTLNTTLGAAGGTFDTNGYSGVYSGQITGSGELIKTGAGTLTLSGGNSHSGGVRVNGGTLQLNHINAAGTGKVTLNNATLGLGSVSGITTPIDVLSTGTLVAGGITLNGAMAGATGTQLNVNTATTGNLTLAGSLADFHGTLNFGGSTGNIRLNGNGANGSSTATFDLGNSGANLRTAFAATVNLGALKGGSSAELNGATNNNGLVHYIIGAKGQSTTYDGLITNGTNATPGSVAVTKTGSGTLTLGNVASSYSGVTTISGGVLAVASLGNGGVNSSIGSAAADAANLVLDGGALRYTGAATSSDRAFTLGAAGGAIDAAGSGTLNLTSTAAVALAGSGNRTLTLGGSNTGFNNFNAALADPASGKTSLTKTGPGAWRLFGTLTYSGNTTVADGTLYLINNDRLPHGLGKGNLIVNSGATVNMYGANHTINGLFGDGTITTTLNTIRNLTVGGGDADGDFAGTLTQGASQTLNLRKIGSGTQILSGNSNNYTGTTAVVEGSLIVNGRTGTGLATVSSGATLGGNGVIAGGLLAQGAITPGNSPGTLTIESTATFADGSVLTLELADPSQHDKLIVNGLLTLQPGSTLEILLAGLAPEAGQSFDLLDWQQLTGQFSTIVLPTLPNDLAFDTQALYTTGTLSIIAATPEPATLTLVGSAAVIALMRRNRTADQSLHPTSNR